MEKIRNKLMGICLVIMFVLLGFLGLSLIDGPLEIVEHAVAPTVDYPPTLIQNDLYEMTDNLTVADGAEVIYSNMRIIMNQSLFINANATLTLLNVILYVNSAAAKTIRIQVNHTNAYDYGTLVLINTTIQHYHMFNADAQEYPYFITNHGKIFALNTTIHIPDDDRDTYKNFVQIGEDAINWNTDISFSLFESHLNTTDINITNQGNLSIVNSWVRSTELIEYDLTETTAHFWNASYSPIDIDTTLSTAMWNSILIKDANGNATTNVNTTFFSPATKYWFLNDTSVLHPLFTRHFAAGGGTGNTLRHWFPNSYPINVSMDLPSGWAYSKLIYDKWDPDETYELVNVSGNYILPGDPTGLIKDEGNWTGFTNSSSSSPAFNFSVPEDTYAHVFPSSITANAGADKAVYEDTLVNYTAAASTADDHGAIDNYTWLFLDENYTLITTQYGLTTNYTYADPGTYYASLTVSDYRRYDDNVTHTDMLKTSVITKPAAAASTTTAASTSDDDDDQNLWEKYKDEFTLIVIGVAIGSIALVGTYPRWSRKNRKGF